MQKTKSVVKASRVKRTNRTTNVGYFKSRVNMYAQKDKLVVRLHKDGYFRRHKKLPTQVLEPRGPAAVHVLDKNEMRRGLFLNQLSS